MIALQILSILVMIALIAALFIGGCRTYSGSAYTFNEKNRKMGAYFIWSVVVALLYILLTK